MNYDTLLQSIVNLQRDSIARAAVAVNQALLLRNWLIGAHVVEYEQNGENRATHGTRLLADLARDLRRRVPQAAVRRPWETRMDIDADELRPGIEAVFESRRSEFGQGYAVFRTPQEIHRRRRVY
jgi:hypothetical protein